MTEAEAAKQATDRAEKAVGRPTTPYKDESDGGNGILVFSTPLILGAPGSTAGES
jgi:hypothetical protein